MRPSSAVCLSVLLLGIALLGRPARAQHGTAPSCDVEEATVADLQAAMASGNCTSVALVEAYLARIEAVDQSGPALRSVIAIDRTARAQADAMDAERRAGRVRGPLHGVPVLIKDNVGVAGMPTTAGALALQGIEAPTEAALVARLRAAGAVILGKTNLSEWANFRSTRSSSGWSGVGGQTRNPYVLDRSPCGSSSGTGAAVAASLAAVGVGTETDGSIVCPSAVNGLVGLKPTVGLVSRAGVIPLSHSQDTAGPMARTVADAAALLSAMAGPDPADTSTVRAAGHVEADYTRFLDRDGLRGARIGVLRGPFWGYSTDADRLTTAALNSMRAAGAVVVDSLDLPPVDGDAEFTVLLYDFKHDLDRYLAALGPASPVHSMADVIAWNEAHAETSMPWFGQEILLMAQAKGPLTEEAYRGALVRSRRGAQRGIDSLLAAHHLDALVAPTGSPAWPIDLLNGDHFTGASSTPAAVAGYPSITVPAGLAHGLPVGVSFIGGAWSEGVLIRLAYAYEQATGLREAPRYLPTVPFEE